MADTYSYILMKDVQGEKHPDSFAGKVISAFSGGSKPVQVLRGELLTSIPRNHRIPRHDGRPAHNFHSKKDPSITLYGGKDDEHITPLIGNDLHLLEAIKKPCDRFSVFYEDGKIEWGDSLAKGDLVYVRLPGDNTSNPTWSAAKVQYVGQVEGLPGKSFGVEIKESRYMGRGSTDGFFGGYQFFTCAKNCGLFVSLDKLAKEEPNQPLPPTPAAHSAAAPYNLRRTKQASAQGTPVDRQKRFRLNDRVAVHDKKNNAKFGAVRWIGTHVGTRKLDSTHIGIETDEVAVTNHFVRALTGQTHLFSATPSHRLVVPEEFVFKEELARSRPQADKIDVSNPVNVAREFGLTQQELMAQQEYALKEAGKAKKKEDHDRAQAEARRNKAKNNEAAPNTELQEVKNTLDESIDLREQQRIMAEIEKEKVKQDKEKVAQRLREEQGHRANPQQSRPSPPSHHGQGGGHQVQKQNSWHPGDKRPGSDHYEPMPGINSPGQQHRGNPHDNRGEAAANPDHERAHQQYHEQQQQNQQGGYSRNLHDSNRPGLVNQETPMGYPHTHSSNTGQRANEQFGHEQAAGFRREGSYGRLAQAHFENLDNHDDYVNLRSVDPPESHHNRSSQANQPTPHNQYPVVQQNQDAYGGGQPNSHDQQRHNLQQPPNQGAYSNVSPNDPQGYNNQQQPQHQQASPPYSAHHAGQQPHQATNASVGNANHYNLEVGSPVQVASTDPNEPPHYGVIKWIGYVPTVQGRVAGIELDGYMEGCTDGIFKATGEKFFTCPHGRGLYFPLAALLPDMRFGTVAPQGHRPAASYDNPVAVEAEMEVQVDQFILDAGQQMTRYIGNVRGIQGHQNSCYLDSTIFGLFALNDVFDTMFLDPDQSVTSDENRRAVSEQLWKGIVNPLRKNGVVRYESVMRMRNKLEELGKMEGITEKEKDPEEFLNMLFKHVLHTDPFISIKRPFGVEQEFFVQLFVEPDPNLRVPTIGILLKKMFKEQKISFTKVPSKLLIQVPRFGREFKAFQKIVPELRLNVRELADSFKKVPAPDVKPCHICGSDSDFNCSDCGNEQDYVNYCERCSTLFHNNTSQPERAEHRVQIQQSSTQVDITNETADDDGQVAELDLLSVICIETSHYVCFTRDPRDNTDKKWIFFDSMADRQYDTYNIPQVMDCTRELNEWVYSGDRTRLMSTQPRQLPALVRRFTQDIYMCVYIQPDVAMYGE